MMSFRTVSVALLCAAAGSGCAADDSDPAAVVFDRTRLHTVEITVAEGDLGQLATDLESRVPCTVRYDGKLVEGAGVRQKGNTLVPVFSKPSFSLKLDEFDAGARLHGLSKLLLNNSDQDPTLLRELVGAEVFMRAGLPAARIAHAVVSLNGSDEGLYIVAESIDQDFLKLHFGEGNDKGNLYEGPCCGDFVDDPARLELKDEQSDGRTREDVVALADVLLTAPDAELATKAGALLDFDGFVRTYAIEALLDHWDGYSYRGNNYYLYDNPADGRFVFIPHGMDRILKETSFDVEAAPAARLPLRIRAIPTLDDRFHAQLADVVRTAWDEEALLADVDQATRLLRAASAGDQTSKDVSKFSKRVAAFRADLIQRRALVDPAIQCGDGEVQGLETCDDGNVVSGDGCSARCRLEP
jgi:cysteine-rich repeat protein